MGTVIYTVEVLSSFFETFIVMEVLTKLYNPKKTSLNFYIGFIVFLIFGAAVSFLISNTVNIVGISAVWGFTLIIIFSALLLKGKLFYKFISILILFLLNLAVDIITAQVLSRLFDSEPTAIVNSEQTHRILLIIFSKCLFFIVTRIFLFTKHKELNQYNKGYWWVAGIISVSSLFIMMLATYVQLNLSYQAANIFIVLFVFLIFILNIIIYYLILKISKDNLTINRNNLINQHSNMMINHYREMVNTDKKLRRVRHDFDNHLSYMRKYIQHKEYEELENYINKIKTESEHIASFPRTGNEAIDGILEFKLSLAQQKGINVTVLGSAPQKLDIEDYDLCCILTNIIDNAIEACDLLNDIDEEKFIKCSFSIYKKFLKIEIINPVDNYNKDFTTKKQDKELHGIGLESIKIAIEKCNGFCYFGVEDKYFHSKILINL